MDSGSHLLFGLTLAGLAALDPVILQNPDMGKAIAFGTVVGSMAPDFDVLSRLGGYASYIRHHRGITHSIPALFIWPLVISLFVASYFDLYSNFFLLLYWTFIAVIFHVFLDGLNTYGVQCFHPFSKKWVHTDILCIFEPFMFIIHLAGLLSYLVFHFSSAIIFPWIYVITFIYIGIRTWQQFHYRKKIPSSIGYSGICQVIPSFHWFHWRFVLETDTAFYTGKIEYRNITVQDVYHKNTYTRDDMKPILEATMGLHGVRAFLHFAQRVHISCRAQQDGYKVSFSDVRFWYDRKLPFGVDIHLDKELNVVHHTLGWRKKAWDPPYV